MDVINTKVDFVETKDLYFNEQLILEELNFAYKQLPGKFFPAGIDNSIIYNFFMDLENGYMHVAGSRIHLFADEKKWAIVFETNGYHTRSLSAQIDLIYIGNCISYPKQIFPENTYISNLHSIEIITNESFDSIENYSGREEERFEMVDPLATRIKIRDSLVVIDRNVDAYRKAGIEIDDKKQLIKFEELVRYLSETQKNLMFAKDSEICQFLPDGLPKIMTIDDFHHKSIYSNNLPESYETYNMIAKILVLKDTMLWKPVLKSNNHWKNWESGIL